MGLCRVPCGVVLELQVDLVADRFHRRLRSKTTISLEETRSGSPDRRAFGCKRDLSTRPRISAAFSSNRSVTPEAFEIQRLSNRARGISERK